LNRNTENPKKLGHLFKLKQCGWEKRVLGMGAQLPQDDLKFISSLNGFGLEAGIELKYRKP
jgi:hypothetical protein